MGPNDWVVLATLRSFELLASVRPFSQSSLFGSFSVGGFHVVFCVHDPQALTHYKSGFQKSAFDDEFAGCSGPSFLGTWNSIFGSDLFLFRAKKRPN